ncbi:alpha/beta hydrolase [uncultured Shewanella sp.]|uniref:alpha/beta fold hydrolase n=1 Tax=uncultured Shewanella sp. TaxID=173975 RepID=UPI00261413A6|nr:alpha/beta hydrolase [uncultured Shewanella sp.]
MAFQLTVSRYFTTQDDVKLHYIDCGSGTPIVMLPAWSQSVEEFKYQIEALQHDYRMIALDMRGHGLSEQVEYGYRIPRLAKDLYELICFLELEDIVLVGHAMGSAVMLCFWDLFGEALLSKLVMVDMPPVLVSNPIWSPLEMHSYGPLVDPMNVLDVMNVIKSCEGDKYRQTVLKCMLSQDICPEKRQSVLQSRLKFPLKQAAKLFYSNYHQDWRDLFPRITLPCLVVSGRASLTAWRSQQWIAEQLPQSKIVYFEEHEGGKHFMFFENPFRFNRILHDFIQSDSVA